MKWLIPFLALFLSGCEQDEFSDLKLFMAQAGQDSHHSLEPLPQLKQIESYEFDPGKYMDPFMPRTLRSGGGGGGTQPDMNRQKEFLEQFPLDSLKMVGTLEKNGQKYALIKTPDGAVTGIKKGNYMGQNYGLVVRISDSGIDLREMVQDAVGDWIESSATLALQE